MNFIAFILEGPAVDNLETKVSRAKTVFMVLSFSTKILGYYDLFHPDASSLLIPATPTYFVYSIQKEGQSQWPHGLRPLAC